MNGAECPSCGRIDCVCDEVIDETVTEEKTTEKIIDVLIKLQGWRLKVVRWIWPDIEKVRKALLERL